MAEAPASQHTSAAGGALGHTSRPCGLADADAALKIDKGYEKAAQMRTQVVRALNSENRAREVRTALEPLPPCDAVLWSHGWVRPPQVAERAMVAAAIRAAAGGVAVGTDGVWGRSMCWQCYEMGVDAVVCRTAKKHTAQDFELNWEVGAKVTLTVGGKQLRGRIVGFDWASGLHSIEEFAPPFKAGVIQPPKRTHHLKLRAFASGMEYERPAAGNAHGVGRSAAAQMEEEGEEEDDQAKRKLTFGGEGLDD